MSKLVFVLHLFANKGILYQVDENKKSVLGYEWDDLSGLSQFLEKVKKVTKEHPVRVLLDDQISYFLRMKVQLFGEDKRELVFQKIAEKIPGDLKKEDWDFKEISKQGEESDIVAFAPEASFYQIFKDSCKDLSLDVEAIEPEKYALIKSEDAVISLASKEDIVGKDEDVLNLQVVKEEKSVSKKVFNKNYLLIVPGVILVLGAFVFYYFSQQEKSEIKSPLESADQVINLPSPTSSPVATPTISLDKKILSIKILNGSGIAGLASEVKDTLEASGYQDIEIGNADSFDYQKAVVKVKDTKKNYAALLKEALSQDYQFNQDQILDDSSPYDLVLILGQGEAETETEEE